MILLSNHDNKYIGSAETIQKQFIVCFLFSWITFAFNHLRWTFLQKRLRALKLLNFVEDYNTSYYYLISLWIIQVTSTQFRCRLYKLILFNFLDALPDPSNFDAISQSNSTLTVVCCSSNNSRTFCPMTENIFKSCVKKKGMQGWELSVKGKSIQRSKAREQSEQLWRESKWVSDQADEQAT